jgi:hypothetical protein
MAKNIDKEKVKTAYTRGIVSLEVIKLKDMPETVEEAEKIYGDIVKTETHLINDLTSGTPYIIRVAYTENKSKLKSVDPEHMDDMDTYEIGESIQEIYRGLNLPIIKSEFPEKPGALNE